MSNHPSQNKAINAALDHFLTTIFSKARYEEVKYKPIKELVDYHRKHKYLFMTYSPQVMKNMGNIVGNHDHLPIEEIYNLYYESLLLLFEKPPLKERRINVLTHIYGYFKYDLNDIEKADYFTAQNDYLEGRKPYSYILEILKGFSVRFQQEYLLEQLIFDPYPKILNQAIE